MISQALGERRRQPGLELRAPSARATGRSPIPSRPGAAAATSARRPARTRPRSARRARRPNSAPSERSRLCRPTACMTWRPAAAAASSSDQRRRRKSRRTRPARAAPAACWPGSVSASGAGEQVGGEEGDHPAGERDHLAHQAAPDAPRDREHQHADHGVVEPGHPRLRSPPRPGCEAQALQLLERLLGRLARGERTGAHARQVALRRSRCSTASSPPSSLAIDALRVGEGADLARRILRLGASGVAARPSSAGSAAFSARLRRFLGGGLGANGVSSSPGMRTLTGGACRAARDRTPSEGRSPRQHQRDGADQPPAAAALQRFDVLLFFSHAITSPTVRKEPNTTILSPSLRALAAPRRAPRAGEANLSDARSRCADALASSSADAPRGPAAKRDASA